MPVDIARRHLQLGGIGAAQALDTIADGQYAIAPQQTLDEPIVWWAGSTE